MFRELVSTRKKISAEYINEKVNSIKETIDLNPDFNKNIPSEVISKINKIIDDYNSF